MPGDDLKYLDWKVLGRTDKYFIKQFEEETNLKSYLIVDASRSMAFKSSDTAYSSFFPVRKLFRKKLDSTDAASRNGVSKLEYATYLAASIAVLMHFQKDASGLVVYDEDIKTYIPPKATKQNLKAILTELANLQGFGQTNTAASLNSIAERIKRRGLVIVFSDLFDEQNAVINSLKHFRYKKNEVIVFHILDALEMNFTIDSPTIFKDMETNKELLSQPISIIQSYRDAVKTFIDNYKYACRSNNIDYILLSTETPFDVALLEYLNKRKRLN
jgi:uncharacterized protein (DUF58 family)